MIITLFSYPQFSYTPQFSDSFQAFFFRKSNTARVSGSSTAISLFFVLFEVPPPPIDASEHVVSMFSPSRLFAPIAHLEVLRAAVECRHSGQKRKHSKLVH